MEFPLGSLVEVYGEPGSGKTLFASYLIKQSQLIGDTPFYVNTMYDYDPLFFEDNGIDIENLVVATPTGKVATLHLIEFVIRTSSTRLIVVDAFICEEFSKKEKRILHELSNNSDSVVVIICSKPMMHSDIIIKIDKLTKNKLKASIIKSKYFNARNFEIEVG